MTPEAFKKFLEEKHLAECNSCKKAGKARITDCFVVALYLFKEFYDKYNNSN